MNRRKIEKGDQLQLSVVILVFTDSREFYISVIRGLYLN